ncbi:DNA mismatch repair endonuclease MutL [Calothrix sp. PCC 6303]|uniref:DNA mismatch repair endonuclease MutL n=1 Tax=Calothrix sp. PCC 6303 TaxID=1170562 RepID=UPI0002A05699|nr:DNA mismatch repair endonuclease MutL [Calothrix sp. PCC 6303]AFY99241.1 DNA mismatch repair protein MutL [Calothrix sp. PCC 6303]
MGLTIQSLPKEVVHLIAAGEVIDSLAAVVRELVENSLDAGATRIVVYLSPEQWRVRVADNGCGMNYDNLLRAATSHSTSKISNCDDLWRIRSLGFRGEALHSLTMLADVEIMSRTADLEICGWCVSYGVGGEVLASQATAIAPGTVVTISGLFANFPARREGMPSPAQQVKAIQATIQQIALCHPQVAWQVWQNERLWFSISPATTMGRLLPQFLSQVRHHDLQELEVKLSNSDDTCFPTLHLAAGLPDRCHRHRPDWVRLAVNGRMVKLPELEHTILAAYHRTLPRDRFPVCLLHLLVPPEQINWNRNPSKTEVYLHELKYWQEQITQAIDRVLRLNPESVSDDIHTSRVSKLIKVAESEGSYQFNRSIQPDENQSEATANSEQLSANYLKVVGQVNNMYIVAEHPGGLWLIEQHIAHERVLYEKICDDWQITTVESPLMMYRLSETQVLQLQRIGLDIEPFGENLWAIRSIPAMLQQRDDCTEALLELSLGGDLQAAQVAVACRTAIRNGTVLSLEEMQTLVDQWQNTRNPRTCPHGRPIYLVLEESSLGRYFRRSWVIGKSHGI